MLGSPMRPNVSKRQLYEAVFISKLTCQLSSFFVQNFVQTTSTLCKERRPLCTNNDDFARTTTTLYKQRRLCKDNNHFVQTTTTLYKQRRLCKDNDNFVKSSCMTPWKALSAYHLCVWPHGISYGCSKCSSHSSRRSCTICRTCSSCSSCSVL